MTQQSIYKSLDLWIDVPPGISIPSLAEKYFEAKKALNLFVAGKISLSHYLEKLDYCEVDVDSYREDSEFNLKSIGL